MKTIQSLRFNNAQLSTLKKMGWNYEEINKIKISDKFKNVSITESSLIFDNINQNLVGKNIWKATTDFYSPTGSSKFTRVVVEKKENLIKKSIFNVFLENVFPWDRIKDSKYKAIVAETPKKTSFFA